jgi:glutamate racemase
VPVIGVIEPGARAAVAASAGKPIGVIGTAGTIGSGAYEREIRRLAPEARVIAQACPLLVPLVEEGWFDHPATRLVAAQYLEPLRQEGVGSLVLGCTHYPLLERLLQDTMGREVRLIDSAAETARAVQAALAASGIEAPPGHAATHRFAVSDDPVRFRQVGARFLGERLGAAEVVTLGTG